MDSINWFIATPASIGNTTRTILIGSTGTVNGSILIWHPQIEVMFQQIISVSTHNMMYMKMEYLMFGGYTLTELTIIFNPQLLLIIVIVIK